MRPASPLDWDSVTWDEFVAGVAAYREHFSRQAREDAAYLRCFRRMQAEPSMLVRSARSRDLVDFLNAWACRLKAEHAVPALRDWIRVHAEPLEELALLNVADRDVPSVAGDVQDLYGSLLLGVRERVHNMSDAAASKVLHQLAPGLFVMWDKEIKKAAVVNGAKDYGGFLVAMHELADRLLEEAGMSSAQAEQHLQQRLRSPHAKTLAKHLDEANWYWAVGRFSALHGAP